MMSMLRFLRANFIAIGTAIIILAVALFLVWPVLFGAPAPAGGHRGTITTVIPIHQESPAGVHLLVEAGTSTLMDDVVTDLAPGESALTLLKEQAGKDGVRFVAKAYPGMGDLVETIGSFTNGTGGNYWQYTVNGAYVQVGADGYAPKPGDTIAWTFTQSLQP